MRFSSCCVSQFHKPGHRSLLITLEIRNPQSEIRNTMRGMMGGILKETAPP